MTEAVKVRRKRKYTTQEIVSTAKLLIQDKYFTWPSELADECDCSWSKANKVLLELKEQMGLKIYYAGRTKLFLDM